MSFDSENRTVSAIFQRQAQYVVPRYQRGYVWTKVNWRELVSDIRFTLEEGDGITWSHFLGTIVLNRLGGPVDGIQRYEITDGQQRLTTLYFLILACYKRFDQLGEMGSNRAKNYVLPTFLMSRDMNGGEVPVLCNPDLQGDILVALQCAKDKSPLPMNNAFRGLSVYLDAELSSMDMEALTAFFNKMLSTSVVEITSFSDEEIYNIFEVLNARGQRLKQIELLKNHVLKYLKPRDGDVIDKAKDQWGAMVERLEPVCDTDDFVNHFARVYISKDPENRDGTYRLIKEEVPISGLGMFLKRIVEFSKVYADVLNSDDPCVEYFILKGNRQVRPLLCATELLLRRGVICQSARNAAFTLLRNYFFRFNAAGLTSNKTDSAISWASYAVYHCAYETEFKFILRGLFSRLVGFVGFDDFKRGLFTSTSLQYTNKKRRGRNNSKLVGYVLVEYCQHYQLDSSIEPDKLTIEHLMPDDGEYETAQIANLVLTSEDLNSRELGCKPVIEKIEILTDQSSIKVNQRLGQYVVGNEFDYERRKDDMARQLYEEVFPFSPDDLGIDGAALDWYSKCESAMKGDTALLDLLHKYGMSIVKRLERDPSLAEQRAAFEKLKLADFNSGR